MLSPILDSNPAPNPIQTKLTPPFVNLEKKQAFKALLPTLLNILQEKLPNPIKSSKQLGERWVFEVVTPEGSKHYLKAYADSNLPGKAPSPVDAAMEKRVFEAARHYSTFADMFPLVEKLKDASKKDTFTFEDAPKDHVFHCFIHEGVKGNLLYQIDAGNIPLLTIAKSLLAAFILGMNDAHSRNCIVSEDLTQIYYIDNNNSLSPGNILNFFNTRYHSFFRTSLLELIQAIQPLTPEERAQIKQWIETCEKELEGYKRYLESPQVINKFKKLVTGINRGKIYQAMKERIEALKKAIDHQDSLTLRDFIFNASPDYKFFVGLQAIFEYHRKRYIPPELPAPDPRDLDACAKHKEEREKVLAHAAVFENHFKDATPLSDDDFVEWSTLSLGQTGFDDLKQIITNLPSQISLVKIKELADQTKTQNDYFLKLLDLARDIPPDLTEEKYMSIYKSNSQLLSDLEEKAVINNADHTSLGADINIRTFLCIEAGKGGVAFRNAHIDTTVEKKTLKTFRSLYLSLTNQDQPTPALSFYFKLLSGKGKRIRLDYKSDPGKVKTLNSGGPFKKGCYYTMREAIQLFNTWSSEQALGTFQKHGYINLSEHVKKADLMLSDEMVQATLPPIEAIPEGQFAYFLEKQESQEHLYVLFKTASGEAYCFEMEHIPHSRNFKVAKTPFNGWNAESLKKEIPYFVSQIILRKHFHHSYNRDGLPFIETLNNTIKVHYQACSFELDVFSRPGLYKIRGSEGYYTAEQLREKIITEGVEFKLKLFNVPAYSAAFETKTGSPYAYKWKTVGTEKRLKIYVKNKNGRLLKLSLDCFTTPAKFQIISSTDSSIKPGDSYVDNYLGIVLIKLQENKN